MRFFLQNREKRLLRLQKRFKAAQKKSEVAVMKARLKPSPRFDDIFFNGLAHMNDDEK